MSGNLSIATVYLLLFAIILLLVIILVLMIYFRRQVRSRNRLLAEQQKELEKTKKSQERYHGIFNSIADVFSRSDMEGKCVMISPSVEAILGYNPEEVIGKNLADLYAHPEQRFEIVQKLKESGKVENFEFEVVKKGGEVITVSTNAKVYFDSDGKPSGVEAMLRDITAYKRAASEHDKLFNVSFDLLCIASFDGYFKELNPAWEKATGYTIEELKTIPYHEFIIEEDREITASEISKLYDGKVTLDFENRYKTKDGRIIHLSWTATPLQEEGLIYCIARDITEKRRNEQQIIEYQMRLKNLASEITLAEERVRKQIAVDLHDHVGQMLTSIRMQLARVSDQLEDPEAVVRIKNISKSILKAVKATREAIFSLSLPQLNELGLIAATHDWMKEQIEEKYDIRTHLESEETSFKMDENTRVLMFRSLRELMMNVVKHARANNIKISFKTRNGTLEVQVEDDGIGFNYNADLLRLQSSGFGLFSIEERLSDLGGMMHIDSSPGNGTKITLSIPTN